MKALLPSGVLASIFIFLVSFFPASADQGQQSQAGQAMEAVQFPPSDNCTANQPCRTVTGEITRIEETYVIKQPSGSEIHVNIQPGTNIQGLHKTGDKVAAQLSSRGVAHAVVKLKELPKPSLEAPGKTLEDLR